MLFGTRGPRGWGRGLARGLALAGLLAGSAGVAHAAPAWRALVAGFDRYPDGVTVPGAREGARDLGAVLGRRGLGDLAVVTEAAVDRAALLARLTELGRRTGPGDTVLFAFGGLGAADPAAPDGLAVSLRLPGGGALTGADLDAFLRAVEARGGRAILVADASFGTVEGRLHMLGGATAEAASGPGAGDALVRGAPAFHGSLVLAASAPRFRSGAVAIPGVAEPRRVLTYAVARALEGRADLDRDGAVSEAELVAYAARLVYQLSDQRQKIAAALPDDLAAAASRTDRTRGIVIAPTDLGDLPGAAPSAPLLPAAAPPGRDAAAPTGPPVRLAAAAGAPSQFAGLAPAEAKVDVVGRTEDPDLIWDGSNRDVITGDGDLVARSVDPSDLGSVVDRTAALQQLKDLVVAAPQEVGLLPNDDVQRAGAVVKVRVGNAAGRTLVLFDIRGDGAVLSLYPKDNDPPTITDPEFVLPLSVSDPLGADQIVAVTGPGSLDDLQRGLALMNGRKTPVAAVRLLRAAMPPGTLVGSVAVFSGGP